MKHFSSEELVAVLTKIRNSVELTPKEAETLKMYIPFHLNSEQAKKMSKLVEDIRTGKKEPLSEEERKKLHQKNLEQTLENIKQQIPQMSDSQFKETCNMCEAIRRQMAEN